MVFTLVGCNDKKQEEPTIVNNEPATQEEVIEEVAEDTTTQEETEIETVISPVEKVVAPKETLDLTDLYFWVVVYDQLNNELSRTTAKYGTIVKNPDGNDVIVDTNKYFNTYVVKSNSNSTSNPSPSPTQSRTPGLYLNGNLEISWDDFKAAYPDAFDEASKIKPYAMPDGFGGYFYSSYFSSLSYSEPYELVIDKSITDIDCYAFISCDWSKEIVFQGVNTIAEFSFKSCSNLTNIDFGNSVSNIKFRAFSDCDSLTSVTISSSVTYIGNAAFASSSLTSNHNS